ncbi:hypothetical protein [Dactylosporangium salmoneum]|uniref:Uncharacterized protein n=1 Tax=Dactylosporangium salmoneum TaxID=53361 RepID=A0ABN3HL10_9ACTN
MSFDLYFWPSGAARNPRRLAGRLADERAKGLAPDARVLALRAELLRRWPELADHIAPWHHDLGWRQPWGRTDLADRFITLTLSYGWDAVTALPLVAGAYGLDVYDPQSDRLTPPRPGAADAGVPELVTRVAGRVDEDRLVPALRHFSACIGYRYDDLDEAALTGALDNTSDERADGWFEYPLAGTPALTVRLARSPGSTAVCVQIEGVMDIVLATRIEIVLDEP